MPQGLLLAELATGKAAISRAADGSLHLDRVAGAASSPALTLNPQGLPASLSWQDKRGRAVTVSYTGYHAEGGAVYPASVTETVAGSVRLVLALSSLAAHPGFTDSDFALPPMPPPRHAAASAGGAQ